MSIPVREMVLYKHGVGFYLRGGEVSGESVSLTFKSDEINDVLKSLAVFDEAEDGRVLGVGYQTPMDRDARLKNTSVNLTEADTLVDLIRDLRGRQVVMTFETGSGVTTVTGRVVGINTAQAIFADTVVVNATIPSYAQVVLLSATGEVRVYPLLALRNFTIEDSQSEQDLSYFLDTVMTEDNRRTVNIRLSEGDHRLVVSYVAPAPTWRVSYRVIAEGNEAGTGGKALVQGWGLFDNRMEEDLEDVRVTLVAGQPISFVYDLYSSTIPQRKFIKDETRVTGPVEFGGAITEESSKQYAVLEEDPAADYMEQERSRGITVNRLVAPAPARAARKYGSAPAAKTTPAQAEGRETGETFQYVVNAPVSVKRGESAMVPIVSASIEYERELLYNREKLPDHPVAALRFKNTTGLTLERGPVTLVEDSDYRGEAILPFSKDEAEVYLPYAVELGVRVVHEGSTHQVHHQTSVKDYFLHVEMYQIRSFTYKIENSTTEDKTVTVEYTIPENETLYETREPDAKTLTESRWKVAVPAQSTEAFTVQTRREHLNRLQIRNISFRTLSDYLRDKLINQQQYDELNAIITLFVSIKENETLIENLKDERDGLYTKQEEMRRNLTTFGTEGKEGELRNRVLVQFEATQDRLEAIDKEIDVAQAAITQAQQQAQTQIEALGGD